MFWNSSSECVVTGHKTASSARECRTSFTRRILTHARPTASGVFVEDAELPRGRHRVTIQIADNVGRVGSNSFDFNVV